MTNLPQRLRDASRLLVEAADTVTEYETALDVLADELANDDLAALVRRRPEVAATIEHVRHDLWPHTRNAKPVEHFIGEVIERATDAALEATPTPTEDR